MPEGHTVRRWSRLLRAGLGGEPLSVTSPQGRFADGAALLDGRSLVASDAHGKHLFLGFAADPADRRADRWLRVHLGLYGAWELHERHVTGPTGATGPTEPTAPQGAVRVRLVGARAWADLRGPTACEVVGPQEKAAVHARLGPDPLRRDGDPDAFASRVRRSVAPVAGLLMDQAVVAGVGNVYRAEVLFRAGLHPMTAGRDVEPGTVRALWDDLSVLMRDGVRRGSIVTVPADRRPRRRGGPLREDAHFVYRRTGLPCRVCQTPVAEAELAARRLYWCPTCQAR
ncbi:Fpg/Nei family DNA glycosylase [Thalassiella azotivora]